MIHGPSSWAWVGCNTPASTGSRWWMIGVDGGLAGGERGGQCACGEVGVQVDQHQQQPDGQRQAPGTAPGRGGDLMVGECEHAG